MLQLLVLTLIVLIPPFGESQKKLDFTASTAPACSHIAHYLFQKRWEINAPSDHFYTDHFENVYFVDGHKLIKHHKNEGFLEYGSVRDGLITSADVSNPLQIMVFYRDFNRVVFLDNKLSVLRSPVNLASLGIEQAGLVCISGKGGIWVFSDYENRLVYFDEQLQSSHRSRIISSITGSAGKPVYMTESLNRLFLYIPRKGILVFDRFAAHLKTIPYSGPEKFQVIGEQIVYFSEGELLSLDIETGELNSLDLPADEKVDNARLQPGRLFVLSGNKISLYK